MRERERRGLEEALTPPLSLTLPPPPTHPHTHLIDGGGIIVVLDRPGCKGVKQTMSE